MTNIVRTYWTEELVKGKKTLRQVLESEAFLVSSLTLNQLHAPVFDLDFGVVREGNILTFRKAVGEKEWNRVVRQLAQARLITAASVSARGERLLNPHLAFRVPFQLRESSTHGHFHLMVEGEIYWPVYRRILESMCRAGLIETNYLNLSVRRTMGMLIKPPLTKTQLMLRQPKVSVRYDDDGFGSY